MTNTAFSFRSLGAGLALLAPAAAHAAPAGSGSVSIFEAFFIQKNPESGQIELFGSLIIWALLALSVVVVALIVRMRSESQRDRILPEDLHRQVVAALSEGDRDKAQRLIDDDPSYFAQVLGACLREAHAGYVPMLRALELATDEFTARRMRRIEPLHIIGSVAPMLGLFGTVYGMILAFREIVAAGGSPDPVGLAAGIGTALTTTFWGLIVAIPALSAHAFIRNTIDARTSEASLVIEEILSMFRPRRAPINGAGKPATPPDPGALIRAGAATADADDKDDKDDNEGKDAQDD